MENLKTKAERQKEREALAIEIQTGLAEILQELEDMDKAEDEGFDIDLSPAAILQIVWRTNKGLLYWRPLKELRSTDVSRYIVGYFENEIIDSERVKIASVLRRDDEFIEMESYQKVTHYISRLDAERLFKWIKIITDSKAEDEGSDVSIEQLKQLKVKKRINSVAFDINLSTFLKESGYLNPKYAWVNPKIATDGKVD